MVHLADRDLLRAFASAPSSERFQPFVDRYLPFVYSAACRQAPDEAAAHQVACAVFVAFARRARRLPRKTVVAAWLAEAVRVTTKKVKRMRRKTPAPSLVPAAPAALGTRDDDTWARISARLDQALSRLSPKYRHPVLLRLVLNWNSEDATQALRLKPKRFEKRFAKGFQQLVRRLRKAKLLIEPDLLQAVISARSCAVPVPAELAPEILSFTPACFRHRPKLALARSTLRALSWQRAKRLLKIVGATTGTFAVLIGALALTVVLLWRSGWLLPRLVEFGARWQAKQTPELAQPVRAWPAPGVITSPNASLVSTAADLYQSTNIWLTDLKFSSEQWKALEPNRVPAVPDLLRPDGTITLRNPKAKRNGVAGSLGFDYNWTHANMQFSGLAFSNVAVRLRGNGTYLDSLWGSKHPYKVDLNKFEKKQELAGVHTLDLLNLVEDRSYLSDALGYELFRAAGVPAPRTAYAWLTVTVAGQSERKPLGLYLMVENVDADFAHDRFHSRKTPIFKPVTPDLFKDLGDDWSAYDQIYDLKTKATAEQKHRVIEFARLLTHADDAEFNRRLDEFLELEEFARFLAALVLVANYDSLLTYGQNYYMYLDPVSNRFGFIPWDLDQAWGSFPQFGSAMARERASIFHPWVGRNRFLERVLANDAFRQRYRAQLDSLLATVFRPDWLYPRIDALSPVIRPAIAAESTFRLGLFDQAVSTNWLIGPRDDGEGMRRPVHQIKRFIVNRAKSVRAQLDGRSKGILLQANTDWGG